jgi:hypothetical protein
MSHEFHLSDQELLMLADGESSAREVARAEVHLAACWECRARKQDLETAITQFVRFHRSSYANMIPPADGPRALLRAHLSQQTIGNSRSGFRCSFRQKLGWALLSTVLVCGAMPLIWHEISQRYAIKSVVVTVPNPAFTPGATVLLNQPDVCNETRPKNKIVPVTVQQRVFAEYGIQTAQSEDYELDYLITPALGGADDIHNLWPESNKAAVWNAKVKDALEDRLRNLVCEGRLDLRVAQRDIASNWIAAYKRYFQTDRPLAELR